MKSDIIYVSDFRRQAVAKDPRDQQLIELKDTIKELNKTISSLNILIDAANKRE